MTVRPTRETLESLRITLQKMEQFTDSESDANDVTELKRLLLNRIAELETLEALQPEEVHPQPILSDLPAIAASTEGNAVSESPEAPTLNKMN
jgi:hypothetical protein